MTRALKVFISSTSQDLQDHRAVARNVVLDMGWVPVMMEHFGAKPERTIDACTQELAGCDVMVLIVGFRRGSVPTVEQGGNGEDSYTAHELDFARRKSIPVLALLASETWPGNLWEDDAAARQWVKTFRERINLPAIFFDYEPSTTRESERLVLFRAKLHGALQDHRARTRDSVQSRSGEGVDYTDSAFRDLADGNCLPFLGTGVFDPGPLSAAMLSAALRNPEVSNEPPCLATAAEYFERFRGCREDLLSELTQILEEQSARAQPTPVHELLAGVRLKPVPLVVSTTPDLVLERSLEAAGARYTIITHILRSRDCAHDGKILALRQGKAWEIGPFDNLQLGNEDFVIYKPLGSPLLHRHLDPDLEIDTVVITESDHLQFLGGLQNQNTRVPTKFHRAFQTRPLLFLGYTLDVWQYRLVVQVFDAVGTSQQTGMTRRRRLAVREPTSAMEELAWRRLGVDLIRDDAGAFARNAKANLEARQRVTHAA